MSEGERFFTPAEAGREVGCSAASVRRLSEELRIEPARTIGGERLFLARHVEQLRTEWQRRAREAARVVVAAAICWLWAATGWAQTAASHPSGSVFSVSATGATVILTNNTGSLFRYIQLDTNSPAGLLCAALQPGYSATNTVTLQTDGMLRTNTASWVTFTNALAWVAGGGMTNQPGAMFFKMGPGDYYSFDQMTPFQGTVIAVSVGGGTNAATGVTGTGATHQ